MTDLHVRIWGVGPPVLLIHGGNAPDPGSTWSQQRPLERRYKLIVPDRRGYGQSPNIEGVRKDFGVDVRDMLMLLAGEPTHVVGHAYGAIIALLMASSRPNLIRTLTVVEPPAFGVARSHAQIDRFIEVLQPVYDAVDRLTTEQFLRGYIQAFGQAPPDEIRFTPQHLKGVEATMAEPPPWTAMIPIDYLAKSAFPKLVITGDWHPAFEVTANILATRLGAEREIFPGAGHGVQWQGEPFNTRLETFWEQT